VTDIGNNRNGDDQMLDPTKRRKYVFAALDYDLDGGGPEMFAGATARGLANGLWNYDCQMPTAIKSAEEIKDDVQAWLDAHPELRRAKQLSVDYSKIKPFAAPYGEPSAR
jgi:hypothetical protein